MKNYRNNMFEFLTKNNLVSHIIQLLSITQLRWS